MFKEAIKSTPFAQYNESNCPFPNISSEPVQYNSMDVSFLSTVRALLYKRIEKEENFLLTRYLMSADGWDTATMQRFLAGMHLIETLNIVQVQGTDDNVNKAVHLFRETVNEFTEVKKVSTFFKKFFEISCFMDVGSKTTIIFTPVLDMKKWHFLQCAIPVLLPWYFENKQLSEDELELLSSLQEKKKDKYIQCINKIADLCDIRGFKIRSLLKGFESRSTEIACQSVSQEIQHIMESINDHNDRIGRLLIEKDNAETRLYGLREKIACAEEHDSEIMEYFLNNKNLILNFVSDHDISFIATGKLEYFDEEMAEEIINNTHSYVYRGHGSRISTKDMGMLMREIFINQTLHIKLCAAYYFAMPGNIKALTNVDLSICLDSLPNPHIYRYSCLGNYAQAINTLLMNGNYIGAIEQCIASCKSLNFGDSVVMEEFMSYLYNGENKDVNTRCIELPDGNFVTPEEAIEYLKQNKEEQSNE